MTDQPHARRPLLLRLPGLRRYGAQLAKLRAQLSRARAEVRRLERDRRRRPPLSAATDDPQEALERAARFDYYWYNAQKKVDLRRVDGFGRLAARVRSDGRTLLHFDRLYTLWQAVTGLPPEARAVAEIGVFRGGSTRFIAEALRLRGLDHPVYACDTFAGHAAVEEALDARHRVGKQFAGVDLAQVRRYLEGLESVRLLQGDVESTAPTLEAEHRFGLVHIDVDVYRATRFCLEFFAPRVVVGGTIVVDDYGFKTCPGARKAVDEFIAAHPPFRMLHLTTGQAVLIRTSATSP